LKRVVLIAILVVSNAAVLTVSFWVLRQSRNDLVRDFDTVQQRLARETATVLAARLSAMDRDSALLADLVARTRSEGQIERAWQDREILAACQALVTTVPHYRTLGVFGSVGTPPIVAADPLEDHARATPQLLEASVPLAVEVNATHRPAWRGPLLIGPSRAFYLYATPAGLGEALVATIDVALLLQDVLRLPAPGAKYIVADAGSTLWLDCESARTCQHRDTHALSQPRLPQFATRIGTRGRIILTEAPPPSSIDRLTPAAAAVQVMNAGGSTILSTEQSVTTPLGVWSLTLQSSTATIDARQRSLVWQLMLTSIGVIAAMLAIGVFVVRQQRRAATLEVELEAARRLADLRERSDKILDNVPVGILGATAAGKIVFANRFFESGRFPLRERGSGGDGKAALAAWAESLRPDIERALLLGRTGLLPADECNPQGREVRSLDVRVVPLSRPVEDVAALVLVEDLSELHDLRRQLVRAEKLITVGVLSAGLAHEVGTPLMVIRGHAEYLLEKIRTPSVVQGLDAVIAQIDRISSTIRSVLEFSRAQPTQVRPTPLPRAFSQTMELLEWRLRAKQIVVLTHIEPDLPPLAADPLQLEQVLVNLLMNACDASVDTQTIEMSGSRVANGGGGAPSARIRIEITDHGSGIRPEHIHAVFDPYFTTKKAGEGTGLGLTIVSQIVHSHGGDIGINSTPGRGTTVLLSWPSAVERAEHG
jgi:two-component system sensor histidine kinase HydH